MEKYAIRKPFTRTKRESPKVVARRGGKSSAEKRLEAREKQRQEEAEKRRKREIEEKEAQTRRKQRLIDAKEELEKRLIRQPQHGERMLAVLKDRAAGEREWTEHKENNRRIAELKQLIKRLG